MSEPLKLVKAKRTELLIPVSEEQTAIVENKDPLSQIEGVMNALDRVMSLVNHPLAKRVLGQWASKYASQNPQPVIQTQSNLALPVEPVKPVPVEPASTSSGIVPKSELHGKLMSIFNDLPEPTIKKFLLEYVGSENIDDIRTKVKGLFEIFTK